MELNRVRVNRTGLKTRIILRCYCTKLNRRATTEPPGRRQEDIMQLHSSTHEVRPSTVAIIQFRAIFPGTSHRTHGRH